MKSTFCLFGLIALLVMTTYTNANAQSTTVRIEDMTWDEVAAALKAGKTTALYYAGGGEQNGPHMAFGKHNVIADKIGEQIARELGNALVYPVMPFSPNGDPTKKEGFMAFPGTTTVREETFAAVARDIAEGAITSGFKNVVLMGDHGGGQQSLKKVAEELTARYQGKARVHYCPDVYTKSGDDFRKYLDSKNIKGAGHAGVQDTSEVMALKPEWIRKNKINEASPEKGVPGDPRTATPELGKIYLDMKVKLAAAQIRQMVGS